MTRGCCAVRALASLPEPNSSIDQFQKLLRSHGRVFPALRALVWRRLVVAAALYAVEIVATLATPVAINQLLSWTEDPSAGAGAGIAAVVVLAVAAVSAFLLDHLSERVSKAAGAVCRVAACGALFDKALETRTCDAIAADSSNPAEGDSASAADATAGAGSSPAASGADAAVSQGELVALFSTDADALLGLWHGGIGLLLQPLEVFGNIGLLFYYTGAAAAGGLAVVLSALAITHAAGAAVERISLARSAVSDSRLRDALEMLSGQKVVILNGWQARFAGALLQARREEAALTKRAGRLLAIVNTVSSNSVDVISLAVVLLYVFALGKPLTPAVTFTFWVVLGLLHARIFHFPQSLKHYREGTAACARLERVLMRPSRADTRELGVAVPFAGTGNGGGSSGFSDGSDTSKAVSSAASSSAPSAIAAQSRRTAALEAAIEIVDACFGWRSGAAAGSGDGSGSSGTSPVTASATLASATTAGAASASMSTQTLRAVNMRVVRGEFVAIAGPVGSGKSTLLQALLGETLTTEGSVRISSDAVSAGSATGSTARDHGQEGSKSLPPAAAAGGKPRIAYVPQVAWIVPGATVRDNILLGRPFSAARYAAVVHACALTHDFDLWPAGDATIVSSASMSGGQRQRVSLARAVYGVADVYLLDDALSALDGRVARHVLQALLSREGLLAGATRIVVANNPLVIAAADRVALLVPVPANGASAAAITSSDAAAAVAPLSSPAAASAVAASRVGASGSHHHDARASRPHTVITGTMQELRSRGEASELLEQLLRTGAGGQSVDELTASPAVTTGASADAATCHGATTVLPRVRALSIGEGRTLEAADSSVSPPVSPGALEIVRRLSGVSAASSAAGSHASHAHGSKTGLHAGHRDVWSAAIPRAPVGHAAFDGIALGEAEAAEVEAASVAAADEEGAIHQEESARSAASGVSSAEIAAPATADAAGLHLQAGTQPTAAAGAFDQSVLVSSSAATASHAAPSHSQLQLPFGSSWLMGVGGSRFAAGIGVLILLEATAVEVGVYWLSVWSEDPSYASYSLAAYAVVYAAFVLLEQLAAYSRQHVYVAGTVKAGDALHRALVFRLAHAPMSFYDAHSSGALASWFTRDLSSLDAGTWYASEYATLGSLYALLIAVSQIFISAWLLIPTVVVLVLLWVALRQARSEVDGASADATTAHASAALEAASATSALAAPNVDIAASHGAAAGSPPTRGIVSAGSTDAQTAVAGNSSVNRAAPEPARLPSSLTALLALEVAERAPLSEFFTSSLDGLASVRAFGAQAQFRAALAQLLASHARVQLAASVAGGARVLIGNLLGALYYIASVAIIVPLTLNSSSGLSGGVGGAGSFTPGQAGFIVVNSCFSSSMVNLIIEHTGALMALAQARGRLLRHAVETPQEELWDESATAGAKSCSGTTTAVPAVADTVTATSGATGTSGTSGTSAGVGTYSGDSDASAAAVGGDVYLSHEVWGCSSDASAAAGIDAYFKPYYQRMQWADGTRVAGSSGVKRMCRCYCCKPKHGSASAGYSGAVSSGASTASASGTAACTTLTEVRLPKQLCIPPPSWPSQGAVSIRNLQLRYSPSGPLVLRGVDLEIPAGCQTALVGRTGSGKSSILAALTRLVEPCDGSITIDGVATSTIPLQLLRSRLAVISQDPFFCTGTLRRNLDPFRQRSDEQLLHALRQVRLFASGPPSPGAEMVTAVDTAAAAATASGASASSDAVAAGADNSAAPAAAAVVGRRGGNPLDMQIAEGGRNLSVGEQQLLAAARAWLRHPRVLLADEISASLDAASEEALQATLRDTFGGGAAGPIGASATVIQVAHRLASVIQSQLLVVMADGRIEEAGTPWELLCCAPQAVEALRVAAAGAGSSTSAGHSDEGNSVFADVLAAASASTASGSTVTLADISNSSSPATSPSQQLLPPRSSYAGIGAAFRVTGAFASMVAAAPPMQRRDLCMRARAAYALGLPWMLQRMPQYLAPAARLPPSPAMAAVLPQAVVTALA